MSEAHDLLKSSNPDTQALLRVITGLSVRVDRLQAEVNALQFAFDALPEQFVIPGPQGQTPAGTTAVHKDAQPVDNEVLPNAVG